MRGLLLLLTLAQLTQVTALEPQARATTMELYGFGPRLTAMGNTGEAAADDYFAVYANPANLVLNPRIHLGWGGDLVLNRFKVDRQGGEQRYPTAIPDNNYLMHMGISSPLPGWFEDKAALGIALHLPIGHDTRLDAHDPRQPQVMMYDTLGDRLALVAGVGIRPTRWLAIGVSMQLLTTLQGSADIDVSVLDHRITRKHLDIELLTKPYPIVGVTVLPAKGVRVALVWRSKSEVKYGLPLTVDLEDVGRLQFKLSGDGLFLPDVYALAASVQHGAWLTTAGVAWLRWSQLPPLGADVHLELDDRHLKTRGNAPDQLLYVNNAPIDVGARDILQPRAGVEWQALPALVARAGVQYRPTPLPKSDGPAAYLDSPATTLGLGLGVRLIDPTAVHRKPLQLDVSLGWTTLARRTVVKNDPDDPVHATSLSGDNWHIAAALHHDF